MQRRVTHSARIRLRSLATIVKWLTDKGIRPNTKSEAIHYTTEAMAEMIQKETGELFPTTEKALDFLIEHGFEYSGDRNTQVGREVFNALKLDLDSVTHAQEKETLESTFNRALAELIDHEVSKRTDPRQE